MKVRDEKLGVDVIFLSFLVALCKMFPKFALRHNTKLNYKDNEFLPYQPTFDYNLLLNSRGAYRS